VDRVSDAAQIPLFRSAAEEIFGKVYDRTIREIAERLRNGSTQQLAYIAIEGAAAVSIGRLYTHPQSAFGGLYGGGTRRSHRGRGYYRAVVAARVRKASELGARYLLVDALPTSRPILERLGFVQITQTWPCTWRPPSNPA
jgi:GNAT superfamily N-acetyltransferase